MAAASLHAQSYNDLHSGDSEADYEDQAGLRVRR
jgi:hypothetical protein